MGCTFTPIPDANRQVIGPTGGVIAGHVAVWGGTSGQVILDGGTLMAGPTGATGPAGPTGPTGPAGGTGGSGGKLVQLGVTFSNGMTTGSGVIPADDTAPESTEGAAYLSLFVTPSDANNWLIIDSNVMGACSAVRSLTTALFRDAGATAIAAMAVTPPATNAIVTIPLSYGMTAGSTAGTTFTVRAGYNGATGQTFTFNGSASGRLFSTLSKSSLRIWEVMP